MVLVIDVGNTETTIGIFELEKLSQRWSISTLIYRTADEWAVIIRTLFEMSNYTFSDIEGVVISSVVPTVDSYLSTAFIKHFSLTPFFVVPGIKTGINILYDNPSEVGADRVVDAVAVTNLYELPSLVIDFGTATTFDIIDAQKNYLGGAICPGLGISAEALFTKTAKLPKVQIMKPKKVIGKTTTSSIQSGLYYGYLSLVEGIVKRIRNEFGEFKSIIATGGMSFLIASELNFINYIDEDLTLKGLYIIYGKNRD